MAALGEVMRVLLIALAVLLTVNSAVGLEVFKASTDGFWPENSIDAAIERGGRYWILGQRILLPEVSVYISYARQSQKVDAVVIHADEPFDEKSEAVIRFAEELEKSRDLKVYLVQ